MASAGTKDSCVRSHIMPHRDRAINACEKDLPLNKEYSFAKHLHRMGHEKKSLKAFVERDWRQQCFK